jgi:hypothetical protein
MTIRDEFIHRFTGFWSSPGRCHIRILDEPGKPLVVICSQLPDYTGTSVTNAAERIAQDIQSYLAHDNLTLGAAARKYVKEAKLTKMLGDLVSRLKESKTFTIFALESLKLALEFKENHQDRAEKIRKWVWVEHYAKELELFPRGMYSVVTFEEDSWTPNWNNQTLAALSESTGYDQEYFLIEFQESNA